MNFEKHHNREAVHLVCGLTHFSNHGTRAILSLLSNDALVPQQVCVHILLLRPSSLLSLCPQVLWGCQAHEARAFVRRSAKRRRLYPIVFGHPTSGCRMIACEMLWPILQRIYSVCSVLLSPGDRRWIAYPKTGKRMGECSICSSPFNSNPRQINAAKIPETIIYFHKPVHSQSMRLIKASRAGRTSS